MYTLLCMNILQNFITLIFFAKAAEIFQSQNRPKQNNKNNNKKEKKS